MALGGSGCLGVARGGPVPPITQQQAEWVEDYKARGA